jgi:hypothetical protein
VPVAADGLDDLEFVEPFICSSGWLISAHAGNALFDRACLLTRYDERVEARESLQRRQVRQVPHALQIDPTVFEARRAIGLRCPQRRCECRREKQSSSKFTLHSPEATIRPARLPLSNQHQ